MEELKNCLLIQKLPAPVLPYIMYSQNKVPLILVILNYLRSETINPRRWILSFFFLYFYERVYLMSCLEVHQRVGLRQTLCSCLWCLTSARLETCTNYFRKNLFFIETTLAKDSLVSSFFAKVLEPFLLRLAAIMVESWK